MTRRRVLVLLLVCALAPGLWWRGERSRYNPSQEVELRAVPVARASLGELDLLGAWELTSPNTHFGGYSALVALDSDRLLAGSDGGTVLEFPLPGRDGAARFASLGPTANGDKYLFDLEALARDPASGTLWGAYEGRNAVARYSAALAPEARARPADMARWGANSGPEAMTRLGDGRFLVLSEGLARRFGSVHPGLLFSGDPVTTDAPPTRFEFRSPEGFHPVDVAQLPDGRVLILLRKVRLMFPPGFVGALAIADPDEIEEGGVWQARIVARLEAPAPAENYEGLAVVRDAAGTATVWIISDDNFGQFQRTLLLQLGWPARPERVAPGQSGDS